MASAWWLRGPRVRRVGFVLLCAVTLAQSAGNATAPSALGPLPATFTGVLPCADCPGIEYHLDLFADRAYSLRTTYQGKQKEQFDDIGAWAVPGAVSGSFPERSDRR